MTNPETITICEDDIDIKTHQSLKCVLQSGFPNAGEFLEKDYFRTPPEYRILAMDGEKICGQISLVDRHLFLKNQIINVAGIADLSVEQDYSGYGLGTRLIEEWIEFAKKLSLYDISIGLANNSKSVRILTKLGYVNSPTSFMFRDKFGKQKDFMTAHHVYIHPLNLKPKHFSNLLASIKCQDILNFPGETF